MKIKCHNMIELEKFPCSCQKCYCQNDAYGLAEVCAECIYGIHEGPKK
jgi:hypothetical protein